MGIAEEKRQKQRMAKKRKKVVTKKKEIVQEQKEEKKEEKKDFSESFNFDFEEEILSISEKKKRREIVDKLLHSMAKNTLLRINKMEQIFNHRLDGSDIYSFNWVLSNFVNLVIELSSSDRLPALVFCLDRVQCEQLYLKLLSDMEFLEDK